MHDSAGFRQRAHQLPGTSGVIEVNMREEHPIDMRPRNPEFIECSKHRRNGMGGTAVDECGATLVDDEMNRIEQRHQIFGIDGMDAVVESVSDHRTPSAAALDS
jgi:hypothetical protein